MQRFADLYLFLLLLIHMSILISETSWDTDLEIGSVDLKLQESVFPTFHLDFTILKI